MSLREKVVSGLRWSGAAHGGRQIVQILTTIVLVILLSPADFGIIGMAAFFVGLAGLLGDPGTSSALVQEREPSEAARSTVFWLNLGTGTLGAAALAGAAPLVAGFFGEPRVRDLLAVLALSVVVTAAGSVHGAILRRALAFRRLAKIDLMAAAAGAIVGIGSAVAGLGAWSLVGQQLAIAGATTIGAWCGCPWRPRLVFSRAELHRVAPFSGGLGGFTLVNYLARNVDYLVIGKFLGATELGYYTLAYRLMLYPIRNVSAVVGRVMFPAYARVQDDPARLGRMYVRVAGAIGTVTIPIMLGLLVVAVPLVETLFGPAWAPAAAIIMILAPVGLMQSIGTTVGDLYVATGRTGLLLAYGAGATALTTIALVIGVRWGTIGAATAYLVVSMLLLYPSFAIPFRIIGLRIGELAAALRRPFLCGAIMSAVVAVTTTVLPPDLSAPATLALLVVLGAAMYGILCAFLNRALSRELLHAMMARPVVKT